MPAMDPHALISCWETGRRRHTLDRALLLHAVAAPAEPPDALADRPIGQRNAALIRFRRALFGDELQSCLACPACGEQLEFSLSANALLARAPEDVTDVSVDGVRVRMPTTRDLASVAGEPDEASAVRKLFERLIGEPGAPAPSRALLTADQVTRALDDADPCIDVAIDVTCPACAHGWNAPFDIVDFLWEEIDVRARRLLDEVHVLASAYGWTEADILRLSDARRSAYLERTLA
jgi:hypothetical protein